MAETVSRGRGYDEALADAVRVLTEAARRTRKLGAGTGEEHTEPADSAKFAALVLAGVAANIGDLIEGIDAEQAAAITTDRRATRSPAGGADETA